MGVFCVFKIVQMVPNRTKHHIDIMKGPNAFEIIDISYYEKVRFSSTKIFE